MHEVTKLHTITNPVTDSMLWIGDYSALSWHPHFEHLNHVEDLSTQGVTPSLIVVSVPPEAQDNILLSIRRNELTSHCLVLVTQESALSPYLANGLWGKEYQQQYQDYQLKKSQIKLNYQDDLAAKLLCYLWLHSEAAVEPQCEPSKHELYSYPLLAAWGILPQDVFAWLNEIKQKGWIETVKLHNRVRFCASCSSGHLNYVDACPKCKDIDIEDRTSLHCFNCGHVGAQQHFRKIANLECPNCLQGLRHIGVDYDRPIENQHCNSCDTLFVDAVVEAECLHCAQHNSLEQLQIRNIYSFKLAVQGRLLVRQGQEQNLFKLSAGEKMNSAQFLWLIDWQNKLAKRHHHTHSIISIQMLNIKEFLAREGDERGFAQLEALQQRLQSVIRTTDACTNYTNNGLLMLLPMTGPQQLTHLYTKIFNLKELHSTSTIELSVKAISLPAEIGGNISDWLTDQLSKAKSL